MLSRETPIPELGDEAHRVEKCCVDKCWDEPIQIYRFGGVEARLRHSLHNLRVKSEMTAKRIIRVLGYVTDIVD